MKHAAKVVKLGVIVASLAVMTACGGSPKAAPTPTSSPPPSPTVPAATRVAEIETVTVAATTAATPTPTATPSTLTGQDVIATLVALGEADLYQSHASPDGQWRANVLSYPCRDTADDAGETRQRVEQLVLVDTCTGTQQVIGTQLLTCDGALGASGFGGYVWSPDSRIFYYTDARDGAPDGGGGVCWDRPLWALHVDSGAAERLATTWAHDSEWDRLAFIREAALIVQTLSGEELARMSVPDAGTEVCEIAWSPEAGPEDADLVMIQASDALSPGPVSVVCLDALQSLSTPLMHLENVAAPALTWETPDEIVVSGYQDGERRTWPIEQLCPLPASLGSVGSVPDDVAEWDTYDLSGLGVTLPVPPDWIVTEEGGLPSLRTSVVFQPPLWETPAECGYQCPSISLAVYQETVPDGAEDTSALRAWLDARATAEPFGSAVESETVVFFDVSDYVPAIFGGHPGLSLTHSAMGIRVQTTIAAVDGVVVALSKTHVGQFDFEPVYEKMRTSATISTE